MHWVTCAYGGWRGAIRYFLDYASFDNSGACGMFRVQRVEQDDNIVANGVIAYSGDSSTAAGQSTLLSTTRSFGNNGLYHQSRHQNTSASFEVPYYSNYRFTPAKRLSFFDTTDSFQTGWFAEYWHTDSNTRSHQYVPSYVAAGEDFSTFFYLGPPIFYLETTTPPG